MTTATLATEIAEFSALGLALLLLVFGVSLLYYLRRQGGLELSLALMVANPSRRSVFLWGLCASLAALFGIGLSDSVEFLTGTAGVAVDGVRAFLFAVGA